MSVMTVVLSAEKTLVVDRIYTDRQIPNHDGPSWHIVHEWEDQFAAASKLPLRDSWESRRLHENVAVRTVTRLPGIYDALKLIDSLRATETKSLYFAMSPQGRASFSTRSSVIPAIIDFWKAIDLPAFYRAYSNCPLVLISSLEVLTHLQRNDCPLNVHHFPLSLPDKYRLRPGDEVRKTLDVLFAGRWSPLFMDFMRRYEQTHPNIEYLYQNPPDAAGQYSYSSNKRGIIAGVNDRASYIAMLRSARVGFYTTPGMDGGEKRTGGFNPVTPRLFEFLSAGCHVIARYPDNEDTGFFQLAKYWPSADTYEAFAAQLDSALASEPPIASNIAYLERHYTSKRIALLNQLCGNTAAEGS
jgi:hypothetical protein